MKPPALHAFIAFCSPAGATRTVAITIERKLGSLSAGTEVLSVCGEEERDAALRAWREARGKYNLLFVGSPVYGFHPLPPVMDFIRRLPPLAGVYAVPFVTWGGVCSGSALFEMGTALAGKGAVLCGAMKVLAEHSMSWGFSRPLCGGHPDVGDTARIEEGVEAVCHGIAAGHVSQLSPLDISYYGGDRLSGMLEGGFERSKARFPGIRFEAGRCTECGACAGACPVGCITFSPLPVIGAACVRCYACVKVCPEGAMTADFSGSEGVIEKRVRDLGEPRETVAIEGQSYNQKSRGKAGKM